VVSLSYVLLDGGGFEMDKVIQERVENIRRAEGWLSIFREKFPQYDWHIDPDKLVTISDGIWDYIVNDLGEVLLVLFGIFPLGNGAGKNLSIVELTEEILACPINSKKDAEGARTTKWKCEWGIYFPKFYHNLEVKVQQAQEEEELYLCNLEAAKIAAPHILEYLNLPANEKYSFERVGPMAYLRIYYTNLYWREGCLLGELEYDTYDEEGYPYWDWGTFKMQEGNPDIRGTILVTPDKLAWDISDLIKEGESYK